MYYAIFIILVAVLLIATSEFTIKLDLICCKKSIEGTDFRPLAYQILHNEKQLENITQYNNLYKDIDFDFKNYSYLITFGRAAKSVKYSIYDTIFNEKSQASSLRAHSKTPVRLLKGCLSKFQCW